MKLPWRVQLLGGLETRCGRRLIARFRTHKTGALFAYLAYHCERPHPREVLIDLLWPDCPAKAGRHSLSMALSALRRQLEPPGVPEGTVLVADRDAVQLDSKAVTVDVREFEAALVAARRSGTEAERVEWLSRGVELYRGELLPGFYDNWTEQRRLTPSPAGAIVWRMGLEPRACLERRNPGRARLRKPAGFEPSRQTAQNRLSANSAVRRSPDRALDMTAGLPRRVDGVVETFGQPGVPVGRPEHSEELRPPGFRRAENHQEAAEWLTKCKQSQSWRRRLCQQGRSTMTSSSKTLPTTPE